MVVVLVSHGDGFKRLKGQIVEVRGSNIRVIGNASDLSEDDILDLIDCAGNLSMGYINGRAGIILEFDVVGGTFILVFMVTGDAI